MLSKVNKQKFLQHLLEYMNCHSIKSVHAYVDVYIVVLTTAVERSLSRNVAVIGKDTDLLILLIQHYTNWGENSFYFTSSGEMNFSLKKVYYIVHVKNSLSSVIVECILPTHVFLGCGTVSIKYYLRKSRESLKILGSQKMQAFFRDFNKKDCQRTWIARKGEELLAQF